MPANSKYPTIPEFKNRIREDYDNNCQQTFDPEHEDMIRQERVASFMGECVREKLGMPNDEIKPAQN